MNVVLIHESEIIDQTSVTLKDYRAKHLVKVLKGEVGDSLRVGVLDGDLGSGKILKIQKKYPFSVELQLEFVTKPPDKAPIDLILALPRPIMFRRILSQATALGVGTLHVINAARVEKSFWDAGLIEENQYMEHIIHGLEQAVDTIPPKIIFHRRFKPFIEDFVPQVSQNYGCMLVAHPADSAKLHEVVACAEEKILVAIGPEGGWVDYEEDKFREASFHGFTLGKRILKVDTAVINIHGRIMALLESRS